MPGDLIVVVDAGTSALRGVIVDAGGNGTLRRLAAGIERDAFTFAIEPWAGDRATGDFAPELQRVLDVPALFRPHVAAVAFTGQREGVVIAGDDGRALMFSPNTDTRASAEGAAIDAAHGAEVYRTTGHLPSLLLAPAKFAWIRRNHPEAGACTVVPLADWLAATAVGVAPPMSPALAAEIGVLDVSSGEIATDLLAALACDASFPAQAPEGTAIGEVAAGTLAGLPVVLAGPDTQCALAGMGATAPGDCGVAAGWSAPVQLVTSAPVIDAGQRTWTGLHVVDGRWVLESNAGDTGRAWIWTCEMLDITPADADVLAEQAPIGSNDVLAVIGPRVMDAARMTAGVGGVTFPLPFAAFAPERAHLLRAVLEAIAYAIRANVEQLESIAGERIHVLCVGGGMTHSQTFLRILADVTGRPLLVAKAPETSAVGAAALAASSVGIHPSVDAAVAAVAGAPCRIESDIRSAAAYDDEYARWCAMCDRYARVAREM